MSPLSSHFFTYINAFRACGMLRAVCILVLMLGFIGRESLAEAGKPRRAAVLQECPTFIGDLDSGMFFKKERSKAKFPFACFTTKRAASRAGFVDAHAERLAEYTGWWRFALNHESSSCAELVASGTATIFLQIRQIDEALFAEFCPGGRSYSGLPLEDGFILTSQEITPQGTERCGGEKEELTHMVKLEGVRGDQAGSVSYKISGRCLGVENARLCSAKLSGTAFRETHTIWPPAATDINAMGQMCEEALGTCASCHLQ